MHALRFGECSRGCSLKPLSFTAVGHVIKAQCPDLSASIKVKDVLSKPQCQKYFTVLHGPPRSTPDVVITNLRAMFQKRHLPRVQNLLPDVHTINLHPRAANYTAELYCLDMCGNRQEAELSDKSAPVQQC